MKDATAYGHSSLFCGCYVTLLYRDVYIYSALGGRTQASRYERCSRRRSDGLRYGISRHAMQCMIVRSRTTPSACRRTSSHRPCADAPCRGASLLILTQEASHRVLYACLFANRQTLYRQPGSAERNLLLREISRVQSTEPAHLVTGFGAMAVASFCCPSPAPGSKSLNCTHAVPWA